MRRYLRHRLADPDQADASGLVAIGADLEPGTILAAYRTGLFPMPVRWSRSPGWWSPDPRGIIPLDGLKVSRSLRKACARYEVRVDTAFDDVILHTFFTDETLQRCVGVVKQAAEEAGRDPDSVRVWSCLATVGDHLPEPLRLKKTVGRLATYLQGYGDLMVDTNGWDPAVLTAFRADPVVGSLLGAIDQVATTEQLEHIATLLPDEWLAPAAAGTAAQCVATVREQLSLGADAVILHGASPTELTPIVHEYSG